MNKIELTDSFIDMLQNYLGIAIRNNSGDLEAMREGVGASLFHTASSERRNLRTLFRDGPDSYKKLLSSNSLCNGVIHTRCLRLPEAISHVNMTSSLNLRYWINYLIRYV